MIPIEEERRQSCQTIDNVLGDRRKSDRRKLSQLRIATDIAVIAHGEHKDKRGEPEVDHPFAVSSMCDAEEEKVVALLHDVVEDTWVTLDDLRNAGVREDLVLAVDCITRREGESTDSYLDRVASNKVATKVKMQDMFHNSSPARLDPNYFSPERRQRIIAKYQTRTMLLADKVDALNKEKQKQRV